jgi:hypothetical protein
LYTSSNAYAQKGDTKIKIEYNEKGLISHTFNATARTTNNWWVNDDNTDIYYEYEYDKKGNWIKRISYSDPSKQPKDIIERVIVY